MKKNILLVSLILWLGGCNHTPSSSKGSNTNFAVKMPSSYYGKKYHYVIERSFLTTPKNLSLSRKKHILHYHIYTDKLNLARGDEVLFEPTGGLDKAKKLSKNSIFIFTKNTLEVRGVKECDSTINQCFEIQINTIYSLKESSLLSNNPDKNPIDIGHTFH